MLGAVTGGFPVIRGPRPVGRTGQAGTGGCDPVSGGLAAGHTVPLGADAAGAPAGASREPRYGTGPPTSKSSTAVQAVAVVVFVLIEFSLVIIPFVFLVVRPEATKAQVKRVQDWLMSHAPQLMAGVALFAGGYMVISGLIRLS